MFHNPTRLVTIRTLVDQLPWLVLALMLGVTWFAWDHERQTTRRALHSQFDFALRETVSRIEQRVQGYEQMLRGVQSLFSTTHWLNRKALHDYVESLQLDANFSGAQTIGVVEWVPQPLKANHLARMRSAGFVNYSIDPVGQRDVYAPIVQREPYVGRNRADPGSDLWLDPVRRLAMERARDSGLVAVSGKVELKVDANRLAPPGFIMYLPVYAQGLPRDNVIQRRAHLLGWVYVAFHMSDFMASLYGSQSPGLTVTMYDGTDTSAGALMYHSDTDAAVADGIHAETISAKEYMVVAGHNWTLSLRTQNTFEGRYGRSMDTEIAVGGLVLSLVLALLVWLMIHGRSRALQLAATMTEELRHMAQHDPLTGLPNRALFNDRLNRELERSKRQDGRFAMVFVDIDYFKLINDRFGHAEGDKVLKRVAQQLQGSVRAADTVGRIGGDEFVVLLAQLGESDSVLSLAEKLRQSLKQPFLMGGHEQSISCSIGVAMYPRDGMDPIGLTKCADDAMYRAKQDGRDCVRLSSPDMV
jgi:diguanylate cyclase (GGDEF)-like protein